MTRRATCALAALCVAIACGGPRDDEGTGAAAGDGAMVDGNAAADAGGDEGPPVRGDWLVEHTLSDPDRLNPYTSSDRGASIAMSSIFQTLLTIDPETLDQVPLLAKALPEISEDQLSYTFALRREPTFADGRPLTSEDVVFSLKVIRNPEVAAPHLRNYFNSVSDAVALDEHTVRIDLSEVYFRNRWILGAFEVIPRHYYDPEDLLGDIGVAELNDWDSLSPEKQERATRFARAFNDDFQRNPMGSGSFALVDPERDYVTGERIVLRHRDNFWAPGNTDLGDAWVDRLVYRIINDREAALVAFKSGDLDFIRGITPIQATRQTGDARFKARAGKHAEIRGAYSYIGWNQTREIFQDVRVRRALSHLVDKQNLVDKVMLGLAKPVEGPIAFQRPEYNENLQPWEYSPEKARAILLEAGWSDTDGDGVLDKDLAGDGVRVPLRFEIISNAGNDERKKIGLTVIDSFKKNGIDASFRSVDWSIMLEKVKKFDYDAVVLGWIGGIAIPPDAYQIWHSSQAIEGGSNHIAYENDEVDRILEEYRVTFDADRRKELYDRFQEILYEEQPYTFLFAGASVSVWDKRFAGVRWYPGMDPDLSEWWVPLDRQKY
ncbi:MAG: ABC transporter substrate-binding protein [Myxococcota bacterium]